MAAQTTRWGELGKEKAGDFFCQNTFKKERERRHPLLSPDSGAESLDCFEKKDKGKGNNPPRARAPGRGTRES